MVVSAIRQALKGHSGIHNPANPDRRAVYLPNPVGLGYQKKIKTAWLAGTTLRRANDRITRSSASKPGSG